MSQQPELLLEYKKRVIPALREKNFMKIISLAPEVL